MNVSHFPLTLQPACDVGHKVTTHMSSMLGSVNCTNRSLSWSTPVKIQMYFLEDMVMYFLNTLFASCKRLAVAVPFITPDKSYLKRLGLT